MDDRERINAFFAEGFEQYYETESVLLLAQDCQEDLFCVLGDFGGDGTPFKIWTTGEGVLPAGPWEDLEDGAFTYFWEGWVVVKGDKIAEVQSCEDAIKLWAVQAAPHCAECKRPMGPEECGGEEPCERVCDSCAGVN